MKKFTKIICAALICALITPYLAFAENYDIDAQSYEGIILMTSEVTELTSGSLTENQRAFCEAVVQGFQQKASEIDVSDFNITVSEFAPKDGLHVNLSSLVQTCHPELYYAYGGFSYRHYQGVITSIIPSYSMTEEETAQTQAEIDAEVNKIKGLLTDDMTDYEKILIIHDYLIANYDYDWRVFYQETYGQEVRTIDRFVNEKTGVCEAYSAFFMYLMKDLGIECEAVPSDYHNHIWNKVKIDGEWYNIDVTQDDPILEDTHLPYLSSQPFHRYFLLTDSEIVEADSEGGDHLAWNNTNWAGDAVTVSSDTPLAVNPAKDILGIIAHKDGKSYYIDSVDVDLNATPKTTNNIMLLNTKDGTSSIVFTYDSSDAMNGKDLWHPERNPRAFYKIIFSNLMEYNGSIYFNTPSKVMRLNTDGSAPEEVYDFVEAYPEYHLNSNTYLYGLTTRNDILYTIYNTNIQDLTKNTLITVDIKEQPEPTATPTPTPTPEPLDEPVIETTIDEETQTITEVTVTTDIPEERKEEAIVYIAQYDENGLLLGLEPVSESEAKTTFAPKEDATKVKAFIWNIFNYPLSTCNVFDLLKPRE